MQSILQNLEKRRENVIKSKINTSLSIITNKNNSQLVQQSLLSPPLMNLRSVLKKDKTFAEDAKLRLSIEDYKLMCKNKVLKKMMAKVLNTDVASLTAICKNIVDDVNKYIDLSRKTNKEKTKAKISPIKDLLSSLPPNMKKETLKLSHLPDEIIKNITHNSLKSLYKSKYKLEEYKLVDGIPVHKLLEYSKFLFQNKNALYFLMENNIEIDYYSLSGNTNPIAIQLLKEEIKVNPDARINWLELSRNPKAMKILKANRDKIVWAYLCFNTNPEAMKLIEEEIKINPVHINFENLATNETHEAMKLIDDNLFSKNTVYNTKSIYSRDWNRFWQKLSKNSKAVKILKANREKIDWCELSGNQSDEAIKLLEEEMITNPDIVNWNILSGNPNQRAFAILEANPKNITYRRLSNNSNPKAIELLKKRMEVQNDRLSANDKIDWAELSKNPAAIELIKTRIIYEDNLPHNTYMRLELREKINWSVLSTNPSIFELV
jgi:hypothetical protein